MQNKDLMEINEADIVKHYPYAYNALNEFDYIPRTVVPDRNEMTTGSDGFSGRQRRSTVLGGTTRRASTKVSLVKTVNNLDKTDNLNTEVQNHVLRVIRRGWSIACAVGDIYANTSKLGELKQRNIATRLTGPEQITFNELMNSASLIGMFVSASYVNFMLSNYLSESDSVQITIEHPREIVFDNTHAAMQGSLFELNQQIQQFAKDDASLVKVVKEYYAHLLNELSIRKESMQHLDNYMNYHYKVEIDNFTVDGFDTSVKAQTNELSMQFKEPNEVIGNHVAKYQALRLSKMLMAYDFKKQLNPFVELGGHIFTFMGDGSPGTGKCQIFNQEIDIEINTTTLTAQQRSLLDQYQCPAINQMEFEKPEIVKGRIQIGQLFEVLGLSDAPYEKAHPLLAQQLKINSPTGMVPVNALVRKHHKTAKYYLDDGSSLHCSVDHFVFNNGAKTKINETDYVDTINGVAKIIRVENDVDTQDVFDVALNAPHQYITPNGVIHHNTTLIQMMAGLINEYCNAASYPFHYANFDSANIDSYQGKSGQNCKAFIDGVLNPNIIAFGTVDDIDQVAGKRGDKQSSAGQQEVTGVLMEAFAGANTVVRGNCTFGMFSNYPENVDDALRQRAGARFLVDGPQTLEDYQDILALLIGKNHTIDTGDIDLFATQDIKKMIGTAYENHNLPHEEQLLVVFNDVIKKYGELDTLEKVGHYLKAIQVAEPRFTGRAIKNITDAAKLRAMDFELPDDWFENPEDFVWKSYEDKLNMINELRSQITPEMLIQEINRYADSEFRYANKSDEAAIEDMIRNAELQQRAQERMLKRK